MRTLFITFFALALLSPLFAQAATVAVMLPDSVNVGSSVSAEVFLDTEGNTINAIEGSLHIPSGLSVVEIRYPGSIVSLWVTPPAERSPGTIDFAAVLPGGYRASPELKGHGNLFTLVLKAEKNGTTELAFGSDTRGYLNDGEGTAVFLTRSPARISIVASGAPAPAEIARDTAPPESFVPVVTSGEPYGLEGSVLVFGTQDKDSGVIRFDVGSSYIGFMPESLLSFHAAESPYSLKNGEETKYVYVRAVDASGNMRVEKLAPARFGALSFALTWVLPALLICAFLMFVFKKVLKKRKVSLW